MFADAELLVTDDEVKFSILVVESTTLDSGTCRVKLDESLASEYDTEETIASKDELDAGDRRELDAVKLALPNIVECCLTSVARITVALSNGTDEFKTMEDVDVPLAVAVGDMIMPVDDACSLDAPNKAEVEELFANRADDVPTVTNDVGGKVPFITPDDRTATSMEELCLLEDGAIVD